MPRRPVDDDLALSFDVALRQAIQRRGLGLARLQERLRQAGHPVSQATLSYWQSGRSQPERSDSLKALAVLEQVLEVEPGALRGSLEPPRRRRREFGWSGSDPLLLSAIPQWLELEQRMMVAASQSRVLAVHDHLDLSGPGPPSQIVRVVQRALVDGVDRIFLYAVQDVLGLRRPAITALRGCELGEQYFDEEGVSVVAELVLPLVLERGETVLVEYGVQMNQPRTLAHDRRELVPIRELVIGVQFAPDRLPRSVWQVTEIAGDQQQITVPLRADGSVQVLAADFGPGQTGLRWSW